MPPGHGSSDVIRQNAGLNAGHRVRLVKGSHIVVPKFWDGPQAYLFQNDDRRVIFVNPYQGDLCLIGTTDIPYNGEARSRRGQRRGNLLSASCRQ